MNIYKLICLNCDKEYNLELTLAQYNENKYRKCCCAECSAKYSGSFRDFSKTKNATCIICNDIIMIKVNASAKTCRCEKCKDRKLLKIKRGKIKSKIFIKDKVICKICGDEKCIEKDICKTWVFGRSKFFIKLGFDETKIGTKSFYEEYYKIAELLKEEYESTSLLELSKKYNVNINTVLNTLNSFNIKLRNISEANILSFKNGRTLPNVNIYPYKSGYHTSWDGNTFWIRSSYELDFCKELDKNKIKYNVETIRIQYFDTLTNSNRTAIPDFYLIDTNEIVEIKSTWTYDEQNMKDKVKAYKESGYNVKLILEHKEIKL